MFKYLILVIIILAVFNSISEAKVFTVNPLLKSAAIPGWGQISLDRNYGYGMLTGEVLFWSTYFYNRNEQNLRDRESYEYALKFAHINPGDYDTQYYKYLTKYNSSGFEAGGYNAMIRQQALDNPVLASDPVAFQNYIDENSIPEDMAWSWDSSQDRQKYSGMRKDILDLKDQAQLITGIIIANHLISTIDMLRLKKFWPNVHTSIRYYKKTPILNLNMEF